MTLDNDLLDLWLLAGMAGGVDEATAKRLIEEAQEHRARIGELERAALLIGKAAVRAANTAYEVLGEDLAEPLVALWEDSELLDEGTDE